MVVQNLTRELIRLMQNIRIHIPGALDDVIRLELFNTLNEFCRKTNVWQEDIDFATVVNTTSYTIAGSEQAQMFRLMSLVNDDDTEVSASMETPEIIVLTSSPSQVETLTATVALTTVDPVDTYEYPYMPDWLLKIYYLPILHGTLGRMMAHPAKPYTNERLAVYYGRKFNGETAAAHAAVMHQNRLGGQRWEFPQNFATGNQR